MTRALVAIGSNIDPEVNVPRALDLLDERFRVLARSHILRTEAIPGPPETEDRPPQADYLNCAVLIETDLRPADLRDALRGIEAELGRVRTADKYAPRTIDLDVVGYDGRITDPDVRRRGFLRRLVTEVLGPGAESWLRSLP